jgi:prepilin-type N-terminal cleavage/methylation domain-containing protein
MLESFFFHSSYNSTPYKDKGFTLVEIAIVLVIIGLLVALGAGLIGPLTKRVKYNDTKDIIDAAVESVVSFAAANNRIPTTSEFPSAVRNPRDAWTKDLYYIPDSNLDNLNAGGVCGRKTTGITIRDCTNTTCTTFNDIPDIAFVIISGNGNFNIQTNNIAGTVTVYEFDTPGIDNCTDANDCPSATTEGQDPDRTESYDDMVEWVKLDELRIKAGCVGAQLKILNSDLPSGFQNTQYNATVSADGGVPFSTGGKYRWCRQESTSTGLTFNPSTLSTDCLGLAEASWGQSDDLTISGIPTQYGNFSLTFFVRDDNDPSDGNDNITQKTFVLTINPPSWIIVRNTTGATRYYRINGVRPCLALSNNATVSVGFTQSITFFRNSFRCNRNRVSCSHNYDTLKSYDADSDGRVRMSNITNNSCTITDD